jgi:hypothetical protein
MEEAFINSLHKSRYVKMLAIANVHKHDQERKALFYILSGNDDLYKKIKEIYDFFENSINIQCLESEKVDFCSSSKALIRLGFNLYNGYFDYHMNPLYLLYCLDSKNLFIAFQAILLRFNGRNYFRLLPVMEDRAMLRSNPSV